MFCTLTTVYHVINLHDNAIMFLPDDNTNLSIP